MQLTKFLRILPLAGALLGAAACDNDDDSPTAPTAAQVAGSYQATTLKATSGSITQDILQAGGTLTLQLAESGTLTGHITIPTEAVNEDFTGTWDLEGNEVDIEDVPGTDTFVEDLEFDVVGNTLVADRVFDGVRVQVVMTKQ